jgi:hypothetical protein
MKKPSAITVESRVQLPVSLLEDHVNSKHHPRKGYESHTREDKVFPRDFENISWCTEELEVEGSIEIHLAGPNRCLSIPVTACVLVVCTRGTSPIYKVTWSSPLS